MSASPALQWFALRVRSNHERKVADSLRGKDVEEFLPTFRQRRRWADRMGEVEQPLFRGYVFSRFDVRRRLPILKIPGVVGVVGTGRTPLALDDVEVSALQRVAAAALAAEPWPYLRIGEMVRVDRGPLQGVEGQLVALKKPARLLLSVTLLQRAVAVEIDELCVISVGSRRPLGTGPGDNALARV